MAAWGIWRRSYRPVMRSAERLEVRLGTAPIGGSVRASSGVAVADGDGRVLGHDGSLVPAAVAAGLDMSAGKPGGPVPVWQSPRGWLMGVQLGFMGVQLGSEVLLGCFARPAAAGRERSGIQLENIV
jgi:hypothetical protein